MTSRSLVSLKIHGTVAVGVLVTALALCSRAHAQQTRIAGSANPPQQRQREVPVTRMPQTTARGTFVDSFGLPWMPVPTVGSNDPRENILRGLDDLRNQLSTAKSPEEKIQIKTSIREVLFVYFNHDMGQRQAELHRLTKRSHDIEALLTKRATARQQLIELQLKAFMHEAEGLGLLPEERTVPRAQGSASCR